MAKAAEPQDHRSSLGARLTQEQWNVTLKPRSAEDGGKKDVLGVECLWQAGDYSEVFKAKEQNNPCMSQGIMWFHKTVSQTSVPVDPV